MKSILRICVFIFFFLLTGCGVAVIAGGAAVGSVVNDSRSLEKIDTDFRISRDIRYALTRKKALKQGHIVVSSYNQIVFLGGEVPDLKSKALAERLAMAHPKVKGIYNEIVIGPNVSLKQMAKDAWISGEVKAKMLTREGLRSGRLKILTENNVVYLMGTVSSEQAELAVDVARRVPGVSKVVKLMKYTD